MDPQTDFAQLQRDHASWWYVARRKLLREAVVQAVQAKREARILDVGCSAGLEFEDTALFRVINQHSSMHALDFNQMQRATNLVCSQLDELAFASNAFDVLVAGDVLQSTVDDLKVLREFRRVLKEGGMLCLTVPAYSFLWGEDDERRGHQRRYTASELRRKLTTSGFEIQRASYFVAGAFLPLVLTRTAKNLVHTTSTRHRHYRQRGAFANSLMVSLLDVERHLMHAINLPFGTRVVCWARKPALVVEKVMVPAWERQWVAPPLPQGSG